MITIFLFHHKTLVLDATPVLKYSYSERKLFFLEEGESKMIEIEGQCYEVIEEVKDGFDQKAFTERYSDILAKYDFIVGDWGYEQLRLKGFYDDQNTKASFDTKVSTVDDYLYEYCNFGCAYFIVKRIDK